MLHLDPNVRKVFFTADVDVFDQSVHVLLYLVFIVAVDYSKVVQLVVQPANLFVFRPALLNKVLSSNKQFIWFPESLLLVYRLEGHFGPGDADLILVAP